MLLFSSWYLNLDTGDLLVISVQIWIWANYLNLNLKLSGSTNVAVYIKPIGVNKASFINTRMKTITDSLDLTALLGWTLAVIKLLESNKWLTWVIYLSSVSKSEFWENMWTWICLTHLDGCHLDPTVQWRQGGTPSGSKFFHFHAVFSRNCKNNRFNTPILGVGAPPFRKIPDLPLDTA